MFGRRAMQKTREDDRCEKMFKTAALDCICGPSRVVIHPVYSENGQYGWTGICIECGLRGQVSTSRNGAAELWLDLVREDQNKSKDHDPALMKTVAEVCLK